MKKIVLVTVAIVSTLAFAGAIKTWNNGDTLSAADITANFQHIHNSMVGGHGARLVDADVSATANISASKLGTIPASKVTGYQGLAKAFVIVQATCNAPGACTMVNAYNVTSVTRGAGAGVYTLTMTTTPTFQSAVMVTPTLNTVLCSVSVPAGAVFTITCVNTAAAATDTGFSFVHFSNS